MLIKINSNEHAYQFFLVRNINTILCISFTSHEFIISFICFYVKVKNQLRCKSLSNLMLICILLLLSY